jgi:DNA-binding MurR/RpiR family transcriptional regulator
MSRKRPPARPEVVGFLGIGLDTDGHRRVTRADHFLVVGGSAETHERMQETVVKFEEALDKTGKRLRDVTPEEAADLLRQARRDD